MEKYKYNKYKSKYKLLKNNLNMKGGREILGSLFETEEVIELRNLITDNREFQEKLAEFNDNEKMIIFTFDGDESKIKFEKKFINSFNNRERRNFLTNDFPYPLFGGVYNYKYIVLSRLSQIIIYKANILDMMLDYLRDNNDDNFNFTIENTLRLVYNNPEDEVKKNLVELLYGRTNDFIKDNELLSKIEELIDNVAMPTWDYNKIVSLVENFVDERNFNIYKDIFLDFDCKVIFTFNTAEENNKLSKIFINLLDFERNFFLESINLPNASVYVDPDNNVIFYKEEELQDLINIFISSNVKIPCVSETNYCSIEKILDLVYNHTNKRQEQFSKILLGEIRSCVQFNGLIKNKKSIELNQLDKDLQYAYGEFIYDNGNFSDRSRAMLQKREYLKNQKKEKEKKEIEDTNIKKLENNMIFPAIISMMITLFMSMIVIIFNTKKRY